MDTVAIVDAHRIHRAKPVKFRHEKQLFQCTHTLVNKREVRHDKLPIISPLSGFIKENLGNVPMASMHQDINTGYNP